MNIGYLCFSVWLTAVCMTGFRFIHLISAESNLFLLISEYIPLNGWVIFHYTYVPQLLYHWFVDEHLDFFLILATVNSATVNTSIHMSFWIMFFQGIWPQVGLMGHYCCSVTKSCLTLSDSMDSSTPYSPVLHYHPEFAQTHVHRVSDAIRTSHLLLSSSPPILNLSQHQGLFQRVNSSLLLAKVLDLLLQHQSFQWIFWVDFFRIDWCDLFAVHGTSKSLQHHSSKASIPQYLAFIMVQISHPYMKTGKTIALIVLTIQTFLVKYRLCFLICCEGLPYFFFWRASIFNFMAIVNVHSDFGAQENKCHSFHFSPSFCHDVMGPDAMVLAFWIWVLSHMVILLLVF